MCKLRVIQTGQWSVQHSASYVALVIFAWWISCPLTMTHSVMPLLRPGMHPGCSVLFGLSERVFMSVKSFSALRTHSKVVGCCSVFLCHPAQWLLSGSCCQVQLLHFNLSWISILPAGVDLIEVFLGPSFGFNRAGECRCVGTTDGDMVCDVQGAVWEAYLWSLRASLGTAAEVRCSLLYELHGFCPGPTPFLPSRSCSHHLVHSCSPPLLIGTCVYARGWMHNIIWC